MAKFNTLGVRAAGRSVIIAEPSPSGLTHEAGPGYRRSAQAELFLLAAGSLAGENSFYEPAALRNQRYRELVRECAVEHPVWTGAFLRWLRHDGNMRTAALVGAAEYVHARLTAGVDTVAEPTGRHVIDSVCVRADEPGEMIAYWQVNHGRGLPKPVKRGLADAVWRLYTESSYLKWNSETRGVRMADVIELVHPTGTLADTKSKPITGTWRADLYEHILDVRHGHGDVDTVSPRLPVIAARRRLADTEPGERAALLRAWGADAPAQLAKAGMTWESLAGWLGGPIDATAWSAILPSMGIMARIRNLRNFDQAGLSDDAIAPVLAQLADARHIERSRLLPFRFYQAYKAAPSLRWGHALEQALQHSLRNVPALPGRTLVLVDTSGSMGGGLSARSTMPYVEVAALFGVALAAKGEQVDLRGFADTVFEHTVRTGASVLRTVDAFCGRIGEAGYGTRIGRAVQASYTGHDRVIIISDMQTFPGNEVIDGYLRDTYYGRDMHDRYTPITNMVPDTVPIYGFNLAGHCYGVLPGGHGNRHELGGLTDATFRMIPLLEAGRRGGWPWEEPAGPVT